MPDAGMEIKVMERGFLRSGCKSWRKDTHIFLINKIIMKKVVLLFVYGIGNLVMGRIRRLFAHMGIFL